MIQFCPNCKHKLEYMGFRGDGSGLYRCSGCGKKWAIKKEEESKAA